MIAKYLLYLVRWQLSTPILAVCVWWLATYGPTVSTIVANFVGGLIFFWIDRWIFRNTSILQGELWETRTNIVCDECGSPADKGYRLVKAKDYDRSGDKRPQFRCHECSRKKYERDHGPAAEGV
ncbi:MAG: hypothetical protein WC869_08650 [Phycisphaerae bacterium]|jgi:hypothetical protein